VPSGGDSLDTMVAAEERGKRMLEEMRKTSGSGAPPLQSLKREPALTPEELAPVDPTEGVMPQEVADRMLGRIVPFASVPILLAVLVFAGFWYANTQLQMDLPPMIVAYATQALLLLSFAGITYGVMSTDLEEGADQTLLGRDNVQRNLDVMRGVEESRIAQTKMEVEIEEAEKAGIQMRPNKEPRSPQ